MSFHIIFENVAGKLDERFCDTDEEIRDTIINLAEDITFRDGDVIRVVEIME